MKGQTATYEEILDMMRRDFCKDFRKDTAKHWVVELVAAADTRAPKCEWLLGICYKEGIGVGRNKIKAKQIFEKARKAGCMRSGAELLKMSGLSRINNWPAGCDNYVKGMVCYCNGEYDECRYFWEAQIDEDDDPIVCYQLGKSITNRGYTADGKLFEYSRELIKHAADAGYAPAQMSWYDGRSGDDALDYLYRAAYQGFPRAINRLYWVLYGGMKYFAASYWYKIAWAADYNKFRLAISATNTTILDKVEKYQAVVVMILCGRWFDEKCLFWGLPKDVVKIICMWMMRLFDPADW